LGRSISAIMAPSIATTPGRKLTPDVWVRWCTGWMLETSKQTISRTRSASRPTWFEPIWTMHARRLGQALAETAAQIDDRHHDPAQIVNPRT
jgi:hypothetical protein